MTETILNYDIVIIGSGAGGGTVAKELSSLCQQGIKIALLEWGGKFEAKDNTQEEIAMAGKYFFDDGGFQTASQDMTMAFAKAVGGSTTVNTGTSLLMPEDVFTKWNLPGVPYADLLPRYEKYKKENNVHLIAPEEINENNRLFAQACKDLDWNVVQFPVNTKGCRGNATCNVGCPELAKQGTAYVQIPAAQKNGVEVLPFTEVLRIEDHDVVATVHPAQHGLNASPLAPGSYRFRAKKIVICAGAIYTPALLLRSFGKKLSPVLGKYFTCHPALILAGEHHRPIESSQGFPKTYYCDHFIESEKFLLETCMYLPFIGAKSLGGFGPEPTEMLSNYDRLQMVLALALDAPQRENRVEIDRHGNPSVHYEFSPEVIRSFIAAMRASARLLFKAGVKRVHAPASKNFFIYPNELDQLDELISEEYFKLGKVALSSAHIMGGARMGADPKESVTDVWGRVHGLKDVYVADASLFPRASEVNPYLTVMVMADRVAEAVRRDLGTA